MTAAYKSQLSALTAAATAPAPAKGTPGPPAPVALLQGPRIKPKEQRSAAALAKEAAARREVVGVGRVAWTNTTFGYPMPCRKFLLADEAQARQLDELFFTLTGTQP